MIDKSSMRLQEEFRTVPLFTDYEVSNFGRVKTKSRMLRYTHSRTGAEHFRKSSYRFLKIHENEHTGYKFCQLYKNSKMHNKTIHQLVAETFLVKPDDAECVNHIDGNKHNNIVENLEWCTNAYNHEHAIKKGLKPFGSRISASILTERCVVAIKNMRSRGFSNGDIADIFEVSVGTVQYACTKWRKVTPAVRQPNSKTQPPTVGLPVHEIDENGNPIKYWKSAKRAGADLSLDPTMILKVARGRYEQYKGHRFALTGTELTITF